MPAPAIINLNDATPAAPTGFENVKWQGDASNPRNVSANVPIATGAIVGLVKPDGTTITVDGSGVLSASAGAGTGTSPVWIGTGNPNGVLTDFAPHSMTGSSAPSPYALTFSDDESWGGVSHAWQTFAGISSGEPYGWVSNTRPEWLKLDLGSTSAVLGKYAIVCGDPASLYFSPPKAWVLAGSNDNSTWTTLDTQTAQTGWGLREKRMFTLSPAASMGYRYYRITVSDWVNDTLGYLNIHEMYLYSVASVFGFGVDGDAYIDKVAGLIYGPRTSGVWPLIPIGGGAGGLADPGANGIIKRTALDITAAATADVDYALPLTAGSGISITSHVITATGGGGGGGGASGSLVNITLNTLAGSNANWQNYSQWIRFSGMGMLQFPASWVVKMQFRAGSPVIGSMCIKRTLAGSTAVIDTTSVTIGGVTNPTLVSPGIVTTDPISIALDDAHDYYFMVYFANVSANASVSAGSGGNFSAASATGDQTGVTTIPTGTANVALFYSMYVP